MTTPPEAKAACPFCTPDKARIFFETPLVYGLWDGYPVSPGHALLIPRRHVATWFDASSEELHAISEAVGQLRNIIEKEHQPDGYNIGVNVGEAGGQTVMHLHLHLIPRYQGDVESPRGGVRGVVPHRCDYDASRPPSWKPGDKGREGVS